MRLLSWVLSPTQPPRMKCNHSSIVLFLAQFSLQINKMNNNNNNMFGEFPSWLSQDLKHLQQHVTWLWCAPQSVFKTLCGSPVTRLELGGPTGHVRDRIFVSSDAIIRGYTRRGKQFLDFNTNTTEAIRSLYDIDAVLQY